jgi:hypothetical protein
MLARLRVKARGRGHFVEARLGSTRDLESLPPLSGEPFEGACAFLGPLNYDPGLGDFSRALAGRLSPGACFVLSWFSPFCLWSAAGDFFKGRWARLARRVTGQGMRVEVGGGKLLGFCHSWSQVKSAFGEFFEPARREGLGVILPPHAWEDRVPEALRGFLGAMDGLFGRFSPFGSLGEQQVAVLKRRGVTLQAPSVIPAKAGIQVQYENGNLPD